MLRDGARRFRDFHLLQHVGHTLKRPQLAPALGTAVERVGNHRVDRLRRKRRAQVLLMAGLPAPPTLGTILSRSLGRLHDVAGRRLRQRGGVFLELGDDRAQPTVFRRQLSIRRFQFRNASLQRRDRLGDHPANIRLRENPAHAPFITSCLPWPNTSFSSRERLLLFAKASWS